MDSDTYSEDWKIIENLLIDSNQIDSEKLYKRMVMWMLDMKKKSIFLNEKI